MSPIEREEKILSLRPFVAEITRGYSRIISCHTATHDELLSAGWLGAIKAVDAFKPSRGVALQVYAAWRIRGEIRDYLRSLDYLSRDERKRVKQTDDVAPKNVSIAQPIATEDSRTIEDTLTDPSGLRAFEVIEATRSLDQLRANVRLTPRVNTCYRKLRAGKTLAMISKEMRVSQGRASQLHASIVEQLRAAA